MKTRSAMITLTITAAGCSSSGADAAGDGGAAAVCETYSACELTSQEDFSAAIGSSLAPHEKPQGNTRQVYHCAVDASGTEPYADVSINCRTDGRSHEQYLLAHDSASTLDGFEEVAGIGRAAFWIGTGPGGGSLEIEVDDTRVVIVAVYAVPDGSERDGAMALAQVILDRIAPPSAGITR